jgi:hypothetical protein
MQGYWSQGKWFRTAGDPTFAEALILATCWSPVSSCALILVQSSLASFSSKKSMMKQKEPGQGRHCQVAVALVLPSAADFILSTRRVDGVSAACPGVLI